MPGNIQVVGDPDSYPAASTDSDGNSTVYAHNILVLVNGSSVVDHVPVRGGFSHRSVKTANGSETVFAHGVSVNYSGNPDTCGHTRAGSTVPEVFVGGVAESGAFAIPTVIVPAQLDKAAEAKTRAQTTDYIANPSAYSNPVAEANGVKRDYAPVPGSVSNESVAPSGASGTDIIPFLDSILAEAANNQWRETGQGGSPSNKNIIGIWKELGFPSNSPWTTDQTAWCAGFVNFVLKKTGYRWAPEAGVVNFKNNPARWNFTSIPIEQAQPGDVAVWNFSHVNFVYSVNNGKYTFCGGNQTPTSGRNNNPDDGDVTKSWPTGWTPSRGGISLILRPSKS